MLTVDFLHYLINVVDFGSLVEYIAGPIFQEDRQYNHLVLLFLSKVDMCLEDMELERSNVMDNNTLQGIQHHRLRIEWD